MSFLPRMKPRSFYDLVIEVAIVRPGPIQGDMVHPYIRRRNGEEPVRYASKELEEVLCRTLGVPLFQEQAMKIAEVAAGFTPSEADRLRRAMAIFRRVGTINSFHEKFVSGMISRGYDPDFAERCFRQIEGFGDYGFPESHAASFALLVYASAWMKCHHPDVFACALLNAQPMGFYAPAQIIRDAREHDVEVRPPDVNHSHWDYTLEPAIDSDYHALRIGLRQIKGFAQEDADWLVAARANGYSDLNALWTRAGISAPVLEKLANADAFGSIDASRREILWDIKALGPDPLPLFAAAHEPDHGGEAAVTLPEMTPGEEVIEDYAAMRLSLKAHPVKLLRPALLGILPNAGLATAEADARTTVCGLVIARQRPGTAKGVIFRNARGRDRGRQYRHLGQGLRALPPHRPDLAAPDGARQGAARGPGDPRGGRPPGGHVSSPGGARRQGLRTGAGPRRRGQTRGLISTTACSPDVRSRAPATRANRPRCCSLHAIFIELNRPCSSLHNQEQGKHSRRRATTVLCTTDKSHHIGAFTGA